jgi:hypothetical protein
LALVAHIAQANRKTSTDGTEFMDPAPKTLKASLGAIRDMEMKPCYFECEESLLLTRIAPSRSSDLSVTPNQKSLNRPDGLAGNPRE